METEEINVLSKASDMFLSLSSTAKRNNNFDMGFTEEELKKISEDLMNIIRGSFN